MFFKYRKNVRISSFLIATIYAFAFGVISYGFCDILSKILFSTNLGRIVGIAFGSLVFALLEAVFLFTKKGVYAYDDRLVLKNGYFETGTGKYVGFSNTIMLDDILDIDFYTQYEPSLNEKFVGLKAKNAHYIVLHLNEACGDIHLYLSVENEAQLCKIIQNAIDL